MTFNGRVKKFLTESTGTMCGSVHGGSGAQKKLESVKIKKVNPCRTHFEVTRASKVTSCYVNEDGGTMCLEKLCEYVKACADL